MERANYFKTIFLCGIGILSVGISYAQRDTIKTGKVVDITSAFKPVIKESAKINFNASPAANDTTKPGLTYDIPNQQLLFAYQPGSLKPLALDIDSGGVWDVSSYIKAGFGSLKTPFVQAGFSFGDGETAGLNIYAKHVSSEGKIDFQDYRNTGVDLKGFLKTTKNLEWNARLGMKQERYYKYGFQPSSLVFLKDSLLQQFQTWTSGIGVHNIDRTQFGISYSPEVLINVFSDERNNNESNTVVNIPIQKTVGKVFAVNLDATFDLTKYKPDNNTSVDNTFYYLSPSILFKTPKINAQAGIRPSWDNKTFKLFPNVTAEISTEDKRFNFQAGWSGYIRRTSYQNLVSQNPFIQQPAGLLNTWIEERYAGFKGSVGDHFTYNTKLGFHKYKNQPLFIQPGFGADGKTFYVVYEPQMKALNYSGEFTYTEQEKFSLMAGIDFYKYTGLKVYDKAFGLIPLELKSAIRVQVMKDLWIKSDLFIWEGAQYMTQTGGSARLKGSIDLNAGVEFRVTKNINLWTQFNNIFNKEYQRWNQYRSYGFNFLGGIIFAFDQNVK
ncbi:MAG TPA: hypothetical protein VI548_07825 [Chitinophagaceae bacterium]|nr:hypothetical protein [Chitinophagaceae bacterium]